MMEAAPGKISFKSIAPFVQSNRSLAETTQQLRVDLAVHQKRIQELEMENDFLRERIAEMEVADDDERIEMIAKRRVEKKVKLIKTAALKSIAALQRFVKVIDESIDEGAPLSSSGLFDKAYSPVARASVLEIVPESPPFSPPKVSSDISNLLRRSKNAQKRACEQALSEGAEKKPRNGDLHVELQEREPTSLRCKDEEYPLNVHIPSLEDQPFVADRSKRRTPIVGERSSCNMQRSIAGFLDEVSPSSSTSTRHSEMQEDSNDRDRSRSMISTKQEVTNPAEQLSSGRPSRAASSKIRSYKEPNRKQKMRRSS